MILKLNQKNQRLIFQSKKNVNMMMNLKIKILNKQFSSIHLIMKMQISIKVRHRILLINFKLNQKLRGKTKTKWLKKSKAHINLKNKKICLKLNQNLLKVQA